MKRIPIILFFLVLAPAASAQRSIDEVLRQVENASRELEAQRQLTAAQKQDAATGKYMANPTVEMEKMWGAAGGGQNTELAVVQTIDFPTVYGSRNRIAKLKGSLYEKQWESQRQQLLLQAKQLCIEIVYLYRQRDLLDERLSNAERLSEAYRRKMETGDATSLEANKIAVESISARTAADLNRAELQAKIQQLNTMTGDSDDSFEDVTYPPVETLPSADVLSEAYMSGNPLLESMENTLEIDRRTVALNRGLSLPQFEIGYRHDYGEGRATKGSRWECRFRFSRTRTRSRRPRRRPSRLRLNWKAPGRTRRPGSGCCTIRPSRSPNRCGRCGRPSHRRTASKFSVRRSMRGRSA